MNTLTLLALVMLNVFAMLLVVTVGLPQLARIRMVITTRQIRDNVRDDIFAGALPADDVQVRNFWRVAELASNEPHFFGHTEAVASQSADSDVRGDEVTYDALTTDQKHRMATYEEHFTRAVRSYLTFGSRFWPLLLAVAPARRLLDSFAAQALTTIRFQPTSWAATSSEPVLVTVASPTRLAENLRALAEAELIKRDQISA